MLDTYSNTSAALHSQDSGVGDGLKGNWRVGVFRADDVGLYVGIPDQTVEHRFERYDRTSNFSIKQCHA